MIWLAYVSDGQIWSFSRSSKDPLALGVGAPMIAFATGLPRRVRPRARVACIDWSKRCSRWSCEPPRVRSQAGDLGEPILWRYRLDTRRSTTRTEEGA